MKKKFLNQPSSQPSNRPAVCAVLDDIRSSHNVGSIFRTADALNVGKIYLAGYTPAPKDKFGRANKEIAKVALGAERTVDWEVAKNTSGLIKKLKAENYKIVAVEQHPTASDYKKFKLQGISSSKTKSELPERFGRAVFVFGNEVSGLSEKILSVCDEIIQIPMRGKKESLNVSVAFGVALSRILNL